VSSYGPEGLFEVHLERDPQKRVTTTHGEEPRVIRWNEQGLAERVELPDGSLLDEAAYDDDGLLIAKANGAGEGWKYWYDARGLRTRALDPCQQTTSFEYAQDQPVSATGPDGHTTRYAYDERGSVTGVAYAWGERYFFRHDERGRLVEVTGNLGRVALYEYDRENNVVAETDARGARTTYRYDGLGRPTAMRDALGRETRVTYDARGQRTSVTLADGARTELAYDAAGHLARVVDAAGGSYKFSYRGLNALSAVTQSDGQVWTIEHTGDERIRRIVNPRGEEYVFERDRAGRVIVEKTFDGRELRYERDAAGRVAKISYPDGTDRSFAYDRAGRLVRDATPDDVRRFARDVAGRLVGAVLEAPGTRDETRFERDAFGRLIGETRGARGIRYEVDTFGRRTQRILPNGVTTRYAYDSADGLVGVEHDGFRLALERDVLGRETTRAADLGLGAAAPGLRVTSRYDDLDRIAEQRATAPGPDGSVPRVLCERRWSYDRLGRVERMDDARWGTTTYAYDSLDQLLEAKRGPRREVFAYDGAGSIVSALGELDGLRRETTAELGPGNVLLRSGKTEYAYDKRGRRVQKVTAVEPGSPPVTEYAWDARDQLRGAQLPDGSSVALTYDALGRRVRKQVGAFGGGKLRAIDYVWDGPVLAMQLDSADGPRTFVHAPGTFVPLLQQERGEVFTYVVDQVGTPKELLTRDGRVAWSAAHGAWGDVVAEHADAREVARPGGTVRSPFRLLGQIADEELGLTFTLYRMFDPVTARWVTPDPLGITGGANLNAFDRSPTLAVDPLGLAGTEVNSHNHPMPGKASELPTIKPGTKEWDDAVKAIRSGGKSNFRTETATDAKNLLNESRGNMNRYKRYTDKQYDKGFEMHPDESGTQNAPHNDLPHVKWKDWHSEDQSGAGHIFFNTPN
jgi:RHS repeat-associated protein